MKNPSARQRVHQARIELQAAERVLDSHWGPWQERLRRHRVALLVGSGLLTGIAVEIVPPKHMARVGAFLFSAGTRITRSPLMPTLFGALWASMRKFRGTEAEPATGDRNDAA